MPQEYVSVPATSSKSSAWRAVAFSTLSAAAILSSVMSISAQTAVSASASQGSSVANRLTAPIVESSRVTMPGSVHPLATKANDRGAVSDALKLERIQVVLKRSDAQEAELKRVLTDLHSPGTASYHKWLTPETFGKQFGPSDADIAKLESWLQAQGFSITKLSPGRQVLEISGTAGQLRNTFHTQMHQYASKDGMRYANASAPDVPTALAPVFGGFVSLNNFRFKHQTKVLGKAQLNPATHESKPDWTISTSSGYNLALAPGDFAVQYDLNPVYTAGTKGDGETIAIVNESNINIALVNDYRTLFGLSANPPQIIIDGSDPGIDGINSPYGPNGASDEAYLDVELAGAVAPNAQIDLVIANDTAVDNGLTLAMEHAVYTNVAPVVSLSFGGCEANQGSFNTFVSGLWEQAAAQGQTVLVSTGDSGSAGCDGDTQFAVSGQAVNGLASTPFDVAVGGTDFYYSGGAASFGTYWNVTPSNSTPTVSLLTPVPEQPWNDSQYGLNVYSIYSTDGTTSIAAGSGGASTAGLATTTGSTTTYGPYPKPSWQTGTGVPADGARDLPDVSLFAANGLNNSYYPICAGDGDCQAVTSGQTVQISGIGGTSASTPSFAGMMALINQKYGRQGQANYVLYPLAAQFPATFHDVTVGTNTVPCATTTVEATDSNGNITGRYPPKNCKAVSSPLTITDDTYGTTTEGEISVDGTNPAYNATTGYDLATGLGTVDANNLLTNWGKITLASTATTLTPSLTTFAHGTAVTITGAVTGASPTGDVSLVTTSTDVNNQGEDFFTLSGSGSYSGSISYLPGGSYNIYGYYPGDGVNGPSSSTPVAVTVTPESSATTLKVYSSLSTLATVPSGGTVQYGAPTILDATPGATASTGTTTGPTGSVSFLDGSSTIDTAVVNANGYADYNGPFAIGSHTITAKYSGDGSYGASTSAATTFSVVQNTPTYYVSASNQLATDEYANGQVTYLSVEIENSSANPNGMALPPTGTISISGAPPGSTTSATLVSGVDVDTNSPQGTGYFTIPATASGNYNVTITYSGDTNYKSTAIGPLTISFDAITGSIATTTTATTTASSTAPTSLVSVTATVASSGSTAPTGTVYLVTSGYEVGSAALQSASGNTSSATVSFNSGSLLQGSNQITVQYIPATGTSFKTSVAEVTITNPLSDFSMAPVSSIVNVPGTGSSAGIQTDVINLSSTYSFAGAVSLSCAGTGGVTCSLSSPTATLASGGQASSTLTVNTTAVAAAGSYNVVVTGTNSAGTVIHTLGLTVVTPKIVLTPGFSLAGAAITIAAPGGSGTSSITTTPVAGFTGNVDLTCAVTSSPAGATGTPTCSLSPVTASLTSAAAATSTLTVTTGSSTTTGTYTVTVTGTSGSLTNSTPVTVTVTPAAAASFSLSGTAVTIASQGATGTSTITVTPANGFTGTVALTCAVASTPTGASDSPTCSATSASVTGTSAVTAALTINTTAQSAKLDVPLFNLHGKGLFTAGGGVALGAILFFGAPFGRRRKDRLKALRAIRILSIAALFAVMAGAAIGCGGGGSTSGSPSPTGGTTVGTYTLTVTGTSGATTATTTITVTVN